MSLFQSFFMGGYECADHINRSGTRINLLLETDHDKQVYEDYKLAGERGITTVREGLCWSIVEPSPFKYDFTEVRNRILAAQQYGIQQLWDICHFGYPDDLIPTHPLFSKRFAGVCRAFAEFYRTVSDDALIVTPINEISFLAWHSGDMRGTVPFAVHSGWDIKYHLCKAAIAGIKALKETDPYCRIMLVEPLIKIHPLPGNEHTPEIVRMNNDQYQAMDIIGGYICPELEGEPAYLDILGFNYYYNNQWEHFGEKYEWPWHKPKQTGLAVLLQQVHERYNRPVVLSETGHFGLGRAEWILETTEQCIAAMQQGVDLKGVCLYPLLDRPDWDNLDWYHNSGLWDLSPQKERILHEDYATALKQCRQAVVMHFNEAQTRKAGKTTVAIIG